MKFLSVFVLILFFSAGYIVGHIVTAKDLTTDLTQCSNLYSKTTKDYSLLSKNYRSNLFKLYQYKLRLGTCLSELRNTEDNLIRCVEQGQLN
jgi:hypothetical protein